MERIIDSSRGNLARIATGIFFLGLQFFHISLLMIIIAKFQRIHNRRNGIVMDPQPTKQPFAKRIAYEGHEWTRDKNVEPHALRSGVFASTHQNHQEMLVTAIYIILCELVGIAQSNPSIFEEFDSRAYPGGSSSTYAYSPDNRRDHYYPDQRDPRDYREHPQGPHDNHGYRY
ncbi:hypothetical protein ANCCEY_06452 [Ancylostoma ceylanicum]|uniref:Uncharacterized protein n=1 Tax=Ancylostoma ceylanicum TaxID=53326 RepID=A0A0D6M3H5_9BILA|nr:hypothetical protein ANCCEY_06452 [Ancylostoma ceylanicum]